MKNSNKKLTIGKMKSRFSLRCVLVLLTIILLGFGFVAVSNQPALADGAPTIDSITPNSGSVAGGTAVSIVGNGFHAAAASMDSVIAGEDHTCGIYQGRAYCWGDNSYGQLGNGTTLASTSPVPVDMAGVLAGLSVKSIAVGSGFTCAVAGNPGNATNDYVYCWGANSLGQLGNGSNVGSSVPTAVVRTTMTASVSTISLGLAHTCALVGGADRSIVGARMLTGN